MAILDSAVLALRANQYDGSSGVLSDESGNGYDATIVNSPAWDGTKFTLVPASSQYLTIADADDLDPELGTFTVVMVVSPLVGDTGNGRVLNKRNNGVPWWSLDYVQASDRFTFTITDGTSSKAAFSATNGAPPGGPYVVSARYGGGAAALIEIGVDGAYVTAGSGTLLTVASATALTIGYVAVFSQYAEIDFYGLAIWKGAYLTDAEVEEAGVGLLASVDSSEAYGLHGDALFSWIQTNYDGSFTSLELVGAMNDINGTTGVEYAQARGTLLGIDPAG